MNQHSVSHHTKVAASPCLPRDALLLAALARLAADCARAADCCEGMLLLRGTARRAPAYLWLESKLLECLNATLSERSWLIWSQQDCSQQNDRTLLL